MKIIRFVSGILMLISGIWHGILGFEGAENRPMLGFAIVYLVIGILLLLGNSWGIYLGIILPIAGIIAASVKIGWSNFDVSMTILIAIDVVVIIACLVLLMNRRKTVITL